MLAIPMYCTYLGFASGLTYVIYLHVVLCKSMYNTNVLLLILTSRYNIDQLVPCTVNFYDEYSKLQDISVHVTVINSMVSYITTTVMYPCI